MNCDKNMPKQQQGRTFTCTCLLNGIKSSLYITETYLIIQNVLLSLFSYYIQSSTNSKLIEIQFSKIHYFRHEEQRNKILLRIFLESEEVKIFVQSKYFSCVFTILASKTYQKGFADHFFLENIIGYGSYGQVFSASKTTQNCHQYAVKVLKRSQTNHKDNVILLFSNNIFQQAINQEIQVLRQLDHPNIVKLRETYFDDDRYYLVMDLIEGSSLKELMKNYKVFEQDYKVILYHLIKEKAVQYLHEKKIMHRDIKPSNIIFRNSKDYSSLILIDFGFAQSVEMKSFIYGICGTLKYMAPEIMMYNQVTSSLYDQKCDMFSIGCLLHEFLFKDTVYRKNFYDQQEYDYFDFYINYNRKKFNKLTKNGTIKKVMQLFLELSLLQKLLETDPYDRISSYLALKHEYFYPLNQDEQQCDLIEEDSPKLKLLTSTFQTSQLKPQFSLNNQSSQINQTQDFSKKL